MLRRIVGPVCVEGQWRSRYNDELYEMYGDLTDDPARTVILGRPQG